MLRQASLKYLWTLIGVLLLCLRGTAQAGESPAPPLLLLANELGPRIDVTKYLVSEKYDGARALWDGKECAFAAGARSRHRHGLLQNCHRRLSMASFGWPEDNLTPCRATCVRASRKTANGGQSNT